MVTRTPKPKLSLKGLLNKWWSTSTKIYELYCELHKLRMLSCTKNESGITNCGVAIADDNHIHTIINYRDRWVLGAYGRTAFSTLGIKAIEKPSTKLILEISEEDEALEGQGLQDAKGIIPLASNVST